jgi:hypothetical protein
MMSTRQVVPWGVSDVTEVSQAVSRFTGVLLKAIIQGLVRTLGRRRQGIQLRHGSLDEQGGWGSGCADLRLVSQGLGACRTSVARSPRSWSHHQPENWPGRDMVWGAERRRRDLVAEPGRRHGYAFRRYFYWDPDGIGRDGVSFFSPTPGLAIHWDRRQRSASMGGDTWRARDTTAPMR